MPNIIHGRFFRAIRLLALPLAINAGSACSGKIIKPEECLSLNQMECQRQQVKITVDDPQFQPEQAYLTKRTNQLLLALPSCSYQGIKEIIFTPNLLTPGAAGERVCISVDSSNGNSSRSCYVNISTNWLMKEPVPTTPGLPHYWEYSLVHEIGHNSLDIACYNGKFGTISFNPDGNPKTLNEADYLLRYSFYPNEEHISAVESPKEDFAYSYASFVLDSGYFKQKAQASNAASQKYYIMQNYVFPHEYPAQP
ncbi:MAG: hypothetical protein KKF06_04475 [Candidatus Margulisbacteria bacterium]|nr:hypothetical protein [Candidatus Margulisiibacteriota bacterium]